MFFKKKKNVKRNIFISKIYYSFKKHFFKIKNTFYFKFCFNIKYIILENYIIQDS